MAEKKQPKKVDIPYRPSSSFRTVTADGAVVNQLQDGLGTTVKITFTRVDIHIDKEVASGKEIEGGLVVSGTPEIVTNFCKVPECEVLLRPDNAFKIARAILDNLARLNPEQRERYQIPELKLEEPESSKRSTRGNANDGTRSAKA